MTPREIIDRRARWIYGEDPNAEAPRLNRVPRAIPTRPGLLARARRALLLRWLTWRADVIRAERLQYEAAGAAGPIYIRNSLVQELALRMRVKRLEACQ